MKTHIQLQQPVLSDKFLGETAEWLIESATVYPNDMSKIPRSSFYCKITERQRNSKIQMKIETQRYSEIKRNGPSMEPCSAPKRSKERSDDAACKTALPFASQPRGR
jgi:hypothetical protein